MQQADFVHLVRVSEIDAQERPAAYRRHLVWFAALGYAYVALSLIAGCALLYWAADLLAHKKFFPAVMAGLAGATMAWVSLQAMVSRVESAQGFEITEQDAPQLFKILAKLRKKLKAPPIHRVIITDDFNAFITQQPRFGVLGAARNTLGLGLPMLMALDAQRLASVLAHEYAHLRGGDGTLATWLYRTRLAWSRLARHAWDSDGHDLFAFVTRGFVNWYAPRFAAKSFAMARQEEYTADRMASKLCGAPTVQAALMEIALLSGHMHSGFWRQYWQLAAQHAQPPQLPYAWLAAGGLKPPPAHEIQAALHHIKTGKTGHSDTHPSTRERVDALGGALQAPLPTVHKAAALLGGALAKAAEHFDQPWWAAQRRHWQRLHQRGQSDLAQIGQLQGQLRHLQPPQIERLARLMERSQPQQSTHRLYLQLLHQDEHHPIALWRLATHHAERGEMSALPYLDSLAASHSHYGYAAASMVLQVLERQTFDNKIGTLRTQWKATQERFSQLEDLCTQELEDSHVLAHCGPHSLGSDEVYDLRVSASLIPDIGKLWLLQRNLKTFPWRKRYVAVVAVPARQQNQSIDWSAIEARLDLPGRVTCLDARWLDEIMPAQQRPTLGAVVYPANAT